MISQTQLHFIYKNSFLLQDYSLLKSRNRIFGSSVRRGKKKGSDHIQAVSLSYYLNNNKAVGGHIMIVS